MATATRDQLQDAAQAVRSSLTEQKDGAASSLGSFAGALRKAARESGDGGQANRMAEWAAGGLESVSSTLRSKDLNGMMREVESFARSQPVAFFFAAAAAGFLASRFLKAGSPAQESPSAYDARPQDFPPAGPAAGAIDRTDISSTTPF
jgi:hypothetical protein